MPSVFAVLALAAPTHRSLAAERNVDGIRDNSFFIEEAYNQDAGVVQHIFSTVYGFTPSSTEDEHRLDFAFTQEWPLFSQTHQLSYTLLGSYSKTGAQQESGFGDMLLNYRFQAWYDEKTLTAVAPRFSLILPTGNASRGFGNDTVGYQWNLPFSTTMGDYWFAHANAGLTFLPNAGPPPRHDLFGYNLGASVIYAATPNLNFMLEWIGNWKDSADNAGGISREFGSLISPGVRRAFNFAGGSQLVVGLGVPIGLTRSTPDIGAFLYFSFEHSFIKKQE